MSDPPITRQQIIELIMFEKLKYETALLTVLIQANEQRLMDNDVWCNKELQSYIQSLRDTYRKSIELQHEIEKGLELLP